jgi:hypothetical protein
MVISASTFLALLCCALAFGQNPAPTYRVVVHPSNVISSIDRKFIADAFLKKIIRWPEGDVVRPADLEPDASARRRFSQEVLGRSVTAVKSYWQQAIFSGRDVPPPELSEAEVIRYVLKHPGGIGYVSGSVDLGGAKVLMVR